MYNTDNQHFGANFAFPYENWARNNAATNRPSYYSRAEELARNAFKRSHLLSAQSYQTSKKIKKSEFAYTCVEDYCKNTSLHGFKILWIVFCICATLGTAYYLHPIFKRYMETPITTTIASMSEQIWNIPFPGITICNVNKAMKKSVLALENNSRWNKYSAPLLDAMVDYIAKIGNTDTNKDFTNEVTKEDFEKAMGELSGADMSKLMKEVMQPIQRMAVGCWWISTQVNCSDIFQPRETDAGLCWAFNSAILENKSNVPKRVNGPGPSVGLIVLLNPDVEEYYSYTNNLNGFMVRIHSPYDFPRVASKSFIVQAGTEAYVAVTPTATGSTGRIKGTPQSKRSCRYPEERSLNYFDNYSYTNCGLECALASMQNTCGCVPYMYYQLPNQSICNYEGMECINKHTTKFLTVTPDKEVGGLINISSMASCDCPPTCWMVTYNYETSEATFPKYPQDLTHVADDIDRSNLVLLRVFFKLETYVQYEMDLVFTANDFIAAFGGIVGLFIGFSFVSFVELIFFFTIRPVLRWKILQKDTTRKVTPLHHRLLP